LPTNLAETGTEYAVAKWTVVSPHVRYSATLPSQKQQDKVDWIPNRGPPFIGSLAGARPATRSNRRLPP